MTARHRLFSILVVCAAGVSVERVAAEGTPAGAASENRVCNPGFELGEGAFPHGWTLEHRLTHFWEKGGPSGRYVRFDTDVYVKQLRHTDKGDADARKQPTKGNKYNTAAGSEGVRSWSAPVAVEPGQRYLMRLDAKGPGGEPFVYLKGFRKLTAEEAEEHGELRFIRPVPGGPAFSVLVGGAEKRRPVAGDYLQTYRARLVCRLPGDGKWRRFHRTIKLRTRKRYRAEVVLLMLYAYWPPGDYGFDNVVLRPITAAESAEWEADRTNSGRSVQP